MSIKLRIQLIILATIVITSFILLAISTLSINNLSEKNIEIYKADIIKNKKEMLYDNVTLAEEIIYSYYSELGEYGDHYLKKRVDILFNIIEEQFNKYKNKISKDEMKKLIINIVTSAKYDGNGYFWINDFNYKMIVNPVNKELNGKFLEDNQIAPYVKLAVDKLKNSSKDIVFDGYTFYSKDTKRYLYKRFVVKVFKPFNWIIGTEINPSKIEEKLKKEALKKISELRYGKNGYFWINDTTPKMIMHPFKPELNGQNLCKIKDPNGVYLFVEMVKVVSKMGEGIVEYHWPKPGADKPVMKISYVKIFKPWDWIIGAGVYTDDIESQVIKMKELSSKVVKSTIVKIVIISLIVAVLLLTIISFMVKYNIIHKIENEKKKIYSMAITDSLTGLYNRHYLNEISTPLFIKCQRYNYPISVAYLDIDHFKKVNDTYGHDKGDLVLQQFADIIKGLIRESDLIFRLGGEEFFIIMPYIDKESAYDIVKRIHQSVKKQGCIYLEKGKICYTFSAGVSDTIESDYSLDSLIKTADKKLYQAKTKGRDKIIF
ncbi:cache domain-containing protein [Hydrogenimonas thermophila]|uniref:sensor domain-containing diguanylate cyclase n=1 Tax=Hydrogenimonas thermophila TaxID=223786 RepID=UPI00293741A3|nr:cache domain-containing protein [Hydrogenimonas thermophila]WOE69269.1 cache domain-containing protein [Hydrogenimonas thermophila]WOE71779.1 cache domain-containing protein [Hydrogenimonas thermophila]